MLNNWRDWQSIGYLIGLPLLVVVQWHLNIINPGLYALTLVLAVGIGCINHNHAHVPLWKSDCLNRMSNYWIGALQGHPVFLFEIAHIASHHRYNQSEQDVTRVKQFGHRNHLGGYLLFPFLALRPLNRLKSTHLMHLWKGDRAGMREALLQHLPLFVLWCATFAINWKKALVFIVIPQIASLHFLLASNYLQHAKVQIGSRYNHSRNFTGFMNTILFNVGFHTAHHEREDVHWSLLPAMHEAISHRVDRSLNQTSLFKYFCIELSIKPLCELLFRRKSNV